MPLDYLTQTYGGDTAGTDGGCFVEFKRILPNKGSGAIPKYAVLPDNTTMQLVCKKWFSNKSTNILQLVAGCKRMNSGETIILGSTNVWYRRCIVFVESHTGNNRLKALNNTVVHEIGHQFEVSGAHVDSDTLHHPNHENSDDCIMTYVSDNTDGKSEFCIDCIKTVRKSPDPLSQGNN